MPNGHGIRSLSRANSGKRTSATTGAKREFYLRAPIELSVKGSASQQGRSPFLATYID